MDEVPVDQERFVDRLHDRDRQIVDRDGGIEADDRREFVTAEAGGGELR